MNVDCFMAMSHLGSFRLDLPGPQLPDCQGGIPPNIAILHIQG
ncbi:hypothetical protein AZ20_0472 [Bordetella bronchiseptica E014]|nr:hypothetical protein L492_0533 [Bordetella bronchiseptica 7E71]KDC17551.1 hypothetical protein AZ20_0472 [Bordetella bronchiseptica E014]KDC66310.1 hypothetical protein L510_0520 [Bordetella bronchiseptica MBORD591]